jgi:hypothetical protein
MVNRKGFEVQSSVLISCADSTAAVRVAEEIVDAGLSGERLEGVVADSGAGADCGVWHSAEPHSDARDFSVVICKQ